jgi:hypothetical protein
VAGYLGLRNLIDFAGGRGAFVGAAIAAVCCLLSIAASFVQYRSVVRPEPADPTGTDAVPVDRFSRLQPAAAAAITIALTVPAAYVLTNALTS